MSVEAFVDLKTALEDALDFERGEGGNLKVTRIQAPPNAHEQKLGAIIVTKMGQKVYRVFDGS